MGNVFTLDSLREEVEKEFAPVEITLGNGEVVTLCNLLRLPKKTRDVVLEKLKALEAVEQEENEIEALAETAIEVLSLVADKGKKLTDEIGDDVSLVLKVLNIWMGSTQPGEAGSSPA